MDVGSFILIFFKNIPYLWINLLSIVSVFARGTKIVTIISNLNNVNIQYHERNETRETTV